MSFAKKREQALIWLRSQAANTDDILAAINAQIAIEVIEEQKAKLEKLGVQFGTLSSKFLKRSAKNPRPDMELTSTFLKGGNEDGRE